MTDSEAPRRRSSSSSPSRLANRRRRRSRRRKKQRPAAVEPVHPIEVPDGEVEVKGVLEIVKGNNGYVRRLDRNFARRGGDAFVPSHLVSKLHLGSGLVIEGVMGPSRRGRAVVLREVHRVMGLPLETWQGLTPFQELTPIDPTEQIRFETEGGPIEMRVVDLMTPIGKGQRGLIVAPPRSGKTVLMQQLAQGIAANHPEIHLMVLLVDERPEEVTDMRRSVKGEVFYSSNDSTPDNHARVARLTVEYARRLVETGKDVVILLDSLTRLGRTFNALQGGGGRTMSGGLDIRALEEPKRMFGSARNLEEGGSLTMIATALVDTGSRMDEFIFQEFKGTGNAEIVLDREMAERRVYPAIDLRLSGTRKEQLILGDDAWQRVTRIRRQLLDMKSSNADIMRALLRGLKAAPTNAAFLDLIPLGR